MKSKILLSVLGLISLVGSAFGISKYIQSQNVGYRSFSPILPLISSVQTTTIGTPILVKDYRTAVFSIETTGNASGTLKFAGSILDTPPDISITSTISNQYTYIEVINLEDGSSIDGDTGFPMATTTANQHIMLEANINALTWITPYLSTYSTGTISVQAIAASNQ